MSRTNHRPTQKQLEPENPIEAAFLKGNSIYGGPNNEIVMIEELQMKSAIKDLLETDILEMLEPTKVVLVEVTVQHTIPGQTDIITDTVTREKRVPMNREEIAEFYRKKYEELSGISSAVAPPPPAPKEPSKPTAKSKKSSKVTK